jgi:hypothetical protein
MTLKQKKQFVISQMPPKSYARMLVVRHFKQPDRQFKCLAHLWGKESAWNYRAKSPTHDYGIPQRHMSRNTRAQIADFMKHPHVQIDWGIGYIKHRYKTPCGALDSWLSRADKNGRGGWY